MKRVQEDNISLEELLMRVESLPGNFSIYYNPENIRATVYLDGNKYVDSKNQPIRVRRCSASDFASIVRSKILPTEIIQTSIF